MKIAIIADVHDNIPNLKKVLDYCDENKIEKIICCGDLASLETLNFLNDNFEGEIFFSFGNMDDDYLKNYPFENNEYKRTKIFNNFGETEVETNGTKSLNSDLVPKKVKIAFVHFPEDAKELCRTGKYKFVFYGHTHRPWEEMINECKMLNPGTVAGQFYPATFAVWNTEDDKFELVRINELK